MIIIKLVMGHNRDDHQAWIMGQVPGSKLACATLGKEIYLLGKEIDRHC